MTIAEKRLWAELRKLKLHVRRQAPIGRFVADFAHHASRIVIEVDSPWHDDGAAQLRDAERDEWLKGQGYSVIRIRGGEVLNDSSGMAERIRSVIERTMAARGARGVDAVCASAGDHPASTPTPAPPPLRGRGSMGA
jgi:very-short-patch-repair endonuclease